MSHAPLGPTAVAHTGRGGPAEALPDWWNEAMAHVVRLSTREREVFRMLGAGHSNRSIAARLKVTERTVKAHVAQILSKLNVESRLQAGLVSYAYRAMDQRPIPRAAGAL